MPQNNEYLDITQLEQINAVQSIRNAETLDDALRVMNGLAANGWLKLWDSATHPDGTSWRDKSPISQNEQQEAVGDGKYAIYFQDNWDGEADKYWTFAFKENGIWKSSKTDNDLFQYEGDEILKIVPLYTQLEVTSPPKQAIPEGWKIVPIESEEQMKDEARAFLTGLELGVKTFESMSEHLRLSGAYLPDWFLNSKGHINKMAKAHYIYESMLNSAPTNTEVGK